MNLDKVKPFRALYLRKDDNGGYNVNIVDDQFESSSIGTVSTQLPNAMIKSIALNCKYEPDINDQGITIQKILDSIKISSYRPHKKIYVSNGGKEMPCAFMYIRAARGYVPNITYVVSLFNHGDIIDIFTIPSTTKAVEDVQIINFEVERFLTSEEVLYIDEEDAKQLFTYAIAYMEEIRKPNSIYK